MKKGLLALIIGVIGIGIWGISTAHDCNLFNEISVIDWKVTPYPAILKDDPILNVVPEEGLHRALLNLQAHCCATNKSDRAGKGCQSSISDWKNRTNYPQSAFLFDHIVDVLMRRLANDRSYPGLPVDKKANEWHSKVDGLVSSVDGVLPLQFQTEYDKYWQLQSNYLLPEYEYSSSVRYPDLIRQLENINKLNKYDQWTIRTSYFNVCSVAVYLNMILAPNNANTPLQKNVKSWLQLCYLKKINISNLWSYINLISWSMIVFSCILISTMEKEWIASRWRFISFQLNGLE